jgi:hypothetical protein
MEALKPRKVEQCQHRGSPREARIDAGEAPGLTSDERARLVELERGEPRAATGQRDGDLKSASAVFASMPSSTGHSSADRPHRPHRQELGVEPICRTLTEAGARSLRAPTTPPSARAVRDEQLKPLIQQVLDANLGLYGVRKVWRQLRQ